MFDDKLCETIEEVYVKRPWLKNKIESNHKLLEAIETLKLKPNYSRIMNQIDLYDLQDWAINKMLKFYAENRIQFLDLNTGD